MTADVCRVKLNILMPPSSPPEFLEHDGSSRSETRLRGLTLLDARARSVKVNGVTRTSSLIEDENTSWVARRGFGNGLAVFSAYLYLWRLYVRA